MLHRVRMCAVHPVETTGAITSEDPGPIPEKYCVHNRTEEGSCCFCGYPLYDGDPAYDYVGEMFCSVACCRKSRGW